jgi:RNA polymerase sigma-70 factor (ECF subfamily)
LLLLDAAFPRRNLGSMTTAVSWLALALSSDEDSVPIRAGERGSAETDHIVPSHPTDRHVVERIRAGDVAAFRELFHAHWTTLCIAAAVYTKEMADAEEIVATIFADLWERRATLAIAVTMRTYLHAAVKHRTVNWRRDRDRRQLLIARATPGEIPGMGTPTVAPDQRASDAETLARALDAVNALPDRYRLAFIYRWREGWSYDDIAGTLGVSVNGAQALVSRALKMIRARIGE